MLTESAKEQLVLALKEAKEGALLSGVNKAMDLLTTFGLCREQVIESKYVGVHGENRDGFGLSAPDCHQLMREIHERVRLDAAFTFNENLVRASGGLLPEMQNIT